MASGLQITCANKNQNGTIIRLGGSQWSMSVFEVIFGITSHRMRFHIYIGDTLHDIGVRGDGRDSYLILEPDGTSLDEVDGLVSC